jgi:NADPH2:quinone reductase
MQRTMQSWWMQLDAQGARLEQRDVPVPQPAAGQLLVRVQAASLNRGEFVAGHGLHGPAGTWKAIGGECAGEVAATGSEADGVRVGERVMGRCAGAFAEYAVMDVAEAMTVPASLSWQEAASIPLTWLVAFDMLVLQGQLQPGEWLLVNGVSSGVGVASLQLGQVLGAQVIGTSTSAAKLERLKSLGLAHGLCTRASDFAPRVMELTGKHGADLVVNAVGGSVFAEDLRCMAFEGRLAMVGYVDGELHADLDLEALHAKRLRLFGVSNKQRTKAQKAAAVPRFAAEILPRFASGALRPLVDEVVDFARLPQAKARMESGGHIGKIVLNVGVR